MTPCIPTKYLCNLHFRKQNQIQMEKTAKKSPFEQWWNINNKYYTLFPFFLSIFFLTSLNLCSSSVHLQCYHKKRKYFALYNSSSTKWVLLHIFIKSTNLKTRTYNGDSIVYQQWECSVIWVPDLNIFNRRATTSKGFAILC